MKWRCRLFGHHYRAHWFRELFVTEYVCMRCGDKYVKRWGIDA